GADEELSDGGSPRVIVYGYDGLPMQLVALPSSDYVPGPKHPPSPDYVPGPEHLPSPIKEDPEEDHADYPTDRGDGDDEPSNDDDDDDDTDGEDEEPFEDEDDDEEEEEHLALTDSIVVPVVDLVPLKRACFTTPSPRLEVEESLAAGAARQSGPTLEADLRQDRVMKMGYGIINTCDEIVEAILEVAPTTLEGVNQRVTELATTIRQENEEFQVRFEDAQDNRAFLRARVNTLFRDRQSHRHTIMLLDKQATYARRAWTCSEDRSAAIEAYVRILEARVSTLIAQTSSL
ncbi:hypothetical protein Tco_0946287, partial [Tanacetum coccineum]